MAHKKHHHHKNWFKAIEKDAAHLGREIENDMGKAVKLAVKGIELYAKIAFLPEYAALMFYKNNKEKIREAINKFKGHFHKSHQDLDEIDHVLNHQEAAIKIAKKKGPDMMLIAGVLVIVVIIVVIIKSSKK